MSVTSLYAVRKKFFAVVFVSLFLGTLSLPMNVFGEDENELQGTWAVIAVETNGVITNCENGVITHDENGDILPVPLRLQMIISGNKVSLTCNGNIMLDGTYKSNMNITPKTVDTYKTNGKVEKGIYRLEGDVLTICSSIPTYPRPLDFSAKTGSGHNLFRLQREKSYTNNNKIPQEFRDSINTCKEAVRTLPDNAEVHVNLGLVYALAGMHEEAIESFKQAIRIDPDNAMAHVSIGGSYAFLDDVDSALEEYKILKDLNPELANFLFNVIEKQTTSSK